MVIIIRQDVEKMAELLRTGYTMLNLSCPVCNNPIFRDNDGNTLCAICNRSVEVIDNELEKSHRENEILKKPITNNMDLIDLKKIIKNKIIYLGQELEKEEKPEFIKIYFDLLSNAIDLLNKSNIL